MRQTGGLPFDEFVLEHGPGLMRTAYLLTLDEHEAEDLLQDCFFQLARRWPKVGSMDNPVAYARRVLVRLVVRGTKQRARRRHELNDESIEIPVTPVAIDQFEARDELRSALRQLAPRQRAVLVLRYFNDLTEAQAAEALGWPVGTVKSSTARSLEQLRHLIEPTPLQGANTHGRPT
jgi:RNA polymerase sigma-70 factor (sigma-E family)